MTLGDPFSEKRGPLGYQFSFKNDPEMYTLIETNKNPVILYIHCPKKGPFSNNGSVEIYWVHVKNIHQW